MKIFIAGWAMLLTACSPGPVVYDPGGPVGGLTAELHGAEQFKVGDTVMFVFELRNDTDRLIRYDGFLGVNSQLPAGGFASGSGNLEVVVTQLSGEKPTVYGGGIG